MVSASVRIHSINYQLVVIWLTIGYPDESRRAEMLIHYTGSITVGSLCWQHIESLELGI